MKNILKTSLFAFLLIALGSCTNDKDPVATAVSGPTLQAPSAGTSFVLLPTNASNIATTFVWDAPNNGVSSASNYTIEIGKAGTNFTPVIGGGTTSSKFLTLTVSEMNALFVEPAFTPYTEANVEVRIKSMLGTSSNAVVQYSNVIALKVTPYSTALPRIAVMKVGDPIASAQSIVSGGYGKTDYEGYLYLQPGDYKFVLPVQGMFATTNPTYGDDGSGSFDTISLNGTAITIATAGYYRVIANTAATSGTNPNGFKYSFVTKTWRMIGAATPNGWGNDTNLTYDNTTKKWSAVISLTTNPFKFRANADWGDSTNNFGGDAGGNLAYNAGNLNFTGAAGNYLVTLDLSELNLPPNPQSRYIYSIVAQ